MVRETRHLWVGNLPDNIREERIREHFKRYGRVQSVKLLPRVTKEETGEITMACTVAFMDIKSASKAHNAELKIDDRTLNTEYYEPTDIPSAASPQNTPSPYSTSPGTIRFPNGHGSADEHGSFPERFYERPATRVGSDGEFIRRTGYHESNRGRNRDRSYRNGPYIDRHRTMNNSWTFDVPARYNNSTTGSSTTAAAGTGTATAPAAAPAPLETGYSTTTPAENNTERRNSDQGIKKKTKSRSGSRSVTPSGSTSSRSPSRSRSRSSSSSSSSTSSRDTSPASSPKSRRQNAANAPGGNGSGHQPVTHSEDRRPLAICVKNLPLRSSDTSLKDGLFHEYKKHGKVTWVKVVGQSAERYAIVCFKKPEDVEKALEVSYDKSFFGCKIEVAPYVGYDVEDNDQRPYEAEIDEYHPKATRTLFIGNLEKDVTASDLRKHFDQFGEIIEIDIKKQGVVSSYAFCQYADIVSVVKAIRKMDGEHLGNNRIKLGFGKSMPTNCVWVDGVGENVTEKYLRLQFESFGVITKLHVDRDKGQALIFYDQLVSAQQAVNKMRGFNLKNNKIQVDFASRECQESFFENLEKQGTVLDRGVFEERRDSTSRSFESNSNRFSRYDTPTRPRTSSYSSRSSAATSQVTSAVPSPGTPGSVTPRGTGSRSRIARFDYYEAGAEYPEARHFRNYDEYSQGSGASHEENYEPEYPYNAHDSPSHLETIEARSLQSVETATPFAPPDIRNLQKERVHLLEQLEECPSSGDEVMSPKKRLKLDLLDSNCASDVIIEANRDHRKVMEVRRFSDANIKHHSRRPSIDSGKHLSSREVGSSHERYVPHAICKRRKTGSSDSGSRVHHYDHSGSESVGGSRPGTPLCDERPENFQPSEPRRIPRDRERDGILSLPLPRFAAQLMNRGSVSVAGIKGQKDNILSSPPAAVTSPRISNPRPPSPIHVPPPASPPPRPPSLSSNSSDSDVNPPSPSLEERIRSLDEKYEKWSGSRTLSAAGSDALAMLDANLEKFRSRHKLLDLDLKEVQPSENLKSVMAKRSVFDEDLKRLENVGEKYEPKEFTLYPRVGVAATTTTTVQTTVPATSLLSALPKITATSSAVPQLPKTPTMLSPRSTGSTIPAAKGLQYPFPSHPPTQAIPSAVPLSPAAPSTPPSSNVPPPSPSALTSTGTSLATPATSSSTTSRSMTHGDNRLKPCTSASSDINRTSSKVNVNRTIVSSSSLVINNNNNSSSTSATVTTTATSKTINTNNSEKNIPNSSQSGDLCSSSSSSSSSSGNSNSVVAAASVTTPTSASSCATNNNDNKFNKNVRDFKSSDKVASEKVMHRRDSAVSSSGSPRADMRAEIRARRNSDTSIKRTEDTNCDSRSQIEDRKKELRLEKVRLENERLERERLEKERVEKERLEKERQEKERIERERLEKERLERESELERQRLEKERLEKEKLERERIERERQEKERAEKERRKEEQERREREERERKDREEREQKEREEKLEKERKDREEREKREAEEKERLDKEKAERDRKREEERSRYKEDNHEKRKDEHRHRENHSESRHSVDKTPNTKDLSKDEKSNHEISSKHEKSRHQSDRDTRKEGAKENRENNIHDKHNKNCDIKENKDRAVVESRHMSIDMDKSRAFENSLINRSLDPNKRKERNNSLPAGIGNKRRLSSHETTSETDEIKRIKLSQEHKKLSERRDSKDSTRSDEKSKNKHKNNSLSKSHDKHNSSNKDDEKRQKEREERHKSKQHKLDKQKSKSKSREKESRESPSTPKSPLTDKDFLARLDLRSTEEVQQHQQKKEKEKRSSEEEKCRDKDDKKLEDGRRKDKSFSSDKSKMREENCSKSSDERKAQKKDRVRKITQNSVDNTDSDEPKKHSIFDIVDDEPAYISMYDKVKARSCKNMQKQEEEKRQEKIKATFSQLKQSRAKREEKKRSTSWDEDSDSDRERMEKSEMKIRRIPKIIGSSDEETEDHKQRKKKVIYTDSDSDRHRVKSELADTSEDGRYRIKNQQFKSSKSRITSDTSEDEIRKIKAELWSSSDNDNDQGFADAEEKFFKYKEQMDRLKKKEKRNNKHSESISEQIFGDSNSPISEIKQEKFNNRHSFGENTSDDDVAEMKRERSESRKKHKKKQKRQKHSISSEDSCKMEMESVQSEGSSEKKHHDKKKQHNKKEKRRDKSKEERDKSKKSKKNKFESKSDVKRDGKMENIFGSLSEDSDNDIRETDSTESKSNSFHNKFEDIKPNVSMYNSESEHETKPFRRDDEKEREKEEHKKRKEKKRREKERRLQEAAAAEFNDNSMDFADMGKQLEANIKDESNDGAVETVKNQIDTLENSEETFRFKDLPEMQEIKKEDRKEGKEKKKKRKKSKEEKQKHQHHHHHHHDKNKVKSPEIKKELLTVDEIKVEIEEPRNEPKNQSLPNISDFNPEDKVSPNFSISPIGREPIISPIPKTPTSSKEKKRDKLIPCFGSEIDEKVHESAVKSISEFDQIKQEVAKEEEPKAEKEEPVPPPPEEKPRTVISQEETEDAVAALLGESFGETQFEECIYNEVPTTNEDTSTNLPEETIVQDDEEMRQAVQSLNAPDLDVKPDTPQSENELQIDTDTEEQEEISLRFDQPPKTPDMAELLKPPKTPDIPSYMRNNEEKISTLIVKPTSTNIGSPPSLTPIVAVAAIPSSPPPLIVTDVKKVEVEIPKNLPTLQDQQRTVISQPWSSLNEKLPKSEPSVIMKANETTSNAVKTNPMAKISEPAKMDSFQPLKLSLITEPSKSLPILSPTSSLHNMPARSPVQIKQHSPNVPNITTTASSDSNLLSPKILNRLPITPVVVSKPLHAVILQPQTKMAHSLEPPKLVSTFEPRPQEKPRMVFQTSSLPTSYSTYSQTAPKVVPPPLVRPQGLLIPSKPISTTYNFVGMSNQPPISTISNPQRAYPNEKEKEPSTAVTTQSSVTQQPPPSIIVSTSDNLTSSSPLTPKPAVIQETAAIRSPVCQQQTIEIPTTSQPIENMDHNQLKVVSETRTSTPSPVIVANVKENIVPSPKIAEEISEPKKLAIETVTEELNLSLEKVENDKSEVEVKEKEIKEEPKETKPVIKEEIEVKKEVKVEEPVNPTTELKEQESVSVIKEVEKFDEEKADTESIISDISKERSSADILTKDDALDNKEDSDYWSAKEVNIDSVIKTLCSADELSNHSSEHGSKDEWFDENKEQESAADTTMAAEKKEKDEPPLSVESKEEFEPLDEGLEDEEKDVSIKCGRPRGRGRGRKPRGCTANVERGGIQTRRGGKVSREPVAVVKRGGRGGRGRSDRRSTKSESENSADVYEFRDDSDESNANKERPRLILTIKSPAVSSANNNQTTAVVKEITKDGAKEIIKDAVKEASPPAKEEPTPVPSPQADSPASNASTSSKATDATSKSEDFISPASNTRKSRRLQERDGSKSSIDDIIEDVVKNTIQTRAAAAQNAAAAAAAAAGTPRRSGRQGVNAKAPTVLQETPRKSPRGRKKDRRNSDATDDSSEEKSDVIKDELPNKGHDIEKPVAEEKVEKVTEEVVKEPLKEKPMESLKAAMLRRVKGDMNHEPTNLIDPVTGLLIPMRESGEEGRYVPLPGSGGNILVPSTASPIIVTTTPATAIPTVAPSTLPSTNSDRIIITSTTKPSITCEPIPKSVITPPQSVAPATVTVIPQQSKPQSLKAHVLSSQAAKEIVSQQQTAQLQQQIALHQQQQPQCKPINLQPTSVPQPVVVSMTKPQIAPPPINQHLNVNVSMPMMGNLQAAHLSPRIPTGAMHTINMAKPLKVKPPQLSPSSQISAINQKHILTAKPQSSVSPQNMKPMLPATPILTPIPSQTLINNQMAHIKTIAQPPALKQQIIITKSPITKPAHSLHSQQQIMTGAVASSPPSLGVLKTQVQLNPARIIQGPGIAAAKGVMEPPKIEVPLSNVILGQRAPISPQGTARHVLTNYEASLGDAIAHFPIRSHDLTSAYQAMQYHQFFRQQGYHLPRSPMMPGGLEKLGDGQEGEEAPVTSPPLELRRPGSVGLGLSSRGSVVPHSLHSPHDRATDSPQVGQIYNVHSSRLPHHAAYTTRHYEPAEPPPAHRPLTSHSSLAALGSDRPPISHITALGNPDRPLSAHLQPERPLSAHVERPLSGHVVLGPAGNILGPVARHAGIAVAPASQQRLQAATPPHANPVPVQGETLFSLLKQYPIMWQGLLTLKNDQAAVQMYFISGNDQVAKRSLPKNLDGSTPPLKIFQRMRLEPPQIEGVTRKMQVENEHCILLALPCGHDHADVVQQSSNLWSGLINYLQQKQAAGIINIAAPGTTSPPAYVMHIFPSCDFVNDNLRRLAPSLLHRVEGIAHLLIVITTV